MAETVLVPHAALTATIRRNSSQSNASSPQAAAIAASTSSGASRNRFSRGAISSRERNVRNASARSEEHTSELQSLMRISYAVFCLKKKIQQNSNSHEDKTSM